MSELQTNLRQNWLDPLLDFLFPPLCAGCGEYFEGSTRICARCDKRIERYDSPICLNCFGFISDGVNCQHCEKKSIPLFALANYDNTMREIIIHLKFKSVTSPINPFASELVERFEQRIKSLKPDLLVPIPLHNSREYERGYNQAELLAYQLASNLSLPVDLSILSRPKKGKPQSKQSLARRPSNIKGVFRLDKEADLPTRVILIDDVITSGSTIREAIRTLETGRYKIVGAISIAHGI